MSLRDSSARCTQFLSWVSPSRTVYLSEDTDTLLCLEEDSWLLTDSSLCDCRVFVDL